MHRSDQESCDVQIKLPEVSKQQAVLRADADSQVWLKNLSKTNPGGTQLNDEPIGQERMLVSGDIVSICGRRFRFEYNEVVAAIEQTLAIDANKVKAAEATVKVATPKLAAKSPNVAAFASKSGGGKATDGGKDHKENAEENAAPAGGRTPGAARTPGVARTPGGVDRGAGREGHFARLRRGSEDTGEQILHALFPLQADGAADSRR